MTNLRGSEWLIILLLVVLLFGAKRLPDAARSLGRSLRIFKAETKGLVSEAQPDAAGPAPSTAQFPAAPLADQPVATPTPPPATAQAAPLDNTGLPPTRA